MRFFSSILRIYVRRILKKKATNSVIFYVLDMKKKKKKLPNPRNIRYTFGNDSWTHVLGFKMDLVDRLEIRSVYWVEEMTLT